MSKGNVVLGFGRGSIGDMVLTRLKGQQVAKARNRHPNNPRTAPQMTQRAGFIAPLKFYTRGIQNFFQFAYTDKRVKESDYNAFMRINAHGGFPLTPTEFYQRNFPALGEWLMSRGSLSGIPVTKHSEHGNNLGLNVTGAPDYTTVGGISKFLVAQNLADVGDIITFVMIRCDGCAVLANSISIDEGAEVRWYINQFRVATSDPTPLDTAMPKVQHFTLENVHYLGIDASTAAVNETTVGLAIVRSKITTKGLHVSTSRIVPGGWVPQFIEFRNTPEEIARVLAEWKASETAILKGGLL